LTRFAALCATGFVWMITYWHHPDRIAILCHCSGLGKFSKRYFPGTDFVLEKALEK